MTTVRATAATQDQPIGKPTGRIRVSLRKGSAGGEKDTPTAAVVSEFLTTALFAVVTTSMANARANGRSLRLRGPISTYLPRHPKLFPFLAQPTVEAGLLPHLTSELQLVYNQLDLVLSQTPASEDEWNGIPITADWPYLAQQWQVLCGNMRLLTLMLLDKDGTMRTGQLGRMLEIEALIKTARYGGTPCVRLDGVVLIPGWLDRRSNSRIPVNVPARIDTGRGAQRVTLKDISVSGAGLKGAPSLAIGTAVTIQLMNNLALQGTVRWSHGGDLGIHLCEPLEEDGALFNKILNLRRPIQRSDRD